MARTVNTPISPMEAERRAQSELARIGCVLGETTDWYREDQEGYKTFFKPTRKRGKARNGQHRGHRCSRTSASGKQGHGK